MCLKMNPNINKYLPYLIFKLVIILDQVSKYIIRANLGINDSIKILGNLIRITYVKNTGISFGLFKGHNILFLLLSILVFILLLFIFIRDKKYAIQLSLIMGGIVGNVIDRIILGYVVDFIDIAVWPVFNIADTAISVGIVWLLFASEK